MSVGFRKKRRGRTCLARQGIEDSVMTKEYFSWRKKGFSLCRPNRGTISDEAEVGAMNLLGHDPLQILYIPIEGPAGASFRHFCIRLMIENLNLHCEHLSLQKEKHLPLWTEGSQYALSAQKRNDYTMK